MLLHGGSRYGSFSTIQSPSNPLITIITPWVLIYCGELACSPFVSALFYFLLSLCLTVNVLTPVSTVCVCVSVPAGERDTLVLRW